DEGVRRGDLLRSARDRRGGVLAAFARGGGRPVEERQGEVAQVEELGLDARPLAELAEDPVRGLVAEAALARRPANDLYRESGGGVRHATWLLRSCGSSCSRRLSGRAPSGRTP